MAEINVGDTVEVFFKGEAVWVNPATGFMDVMTADGLRVAWTTDCTAVTSPLQVGDIITAENVHQLPEAFILVDRQGDAWNEAPDSSDFKLYSPFTLLYIHDEQ